MDYPFIRIWIGSVHELCVCVSENSGILTSVSYFLAPFDVEICTDYLYIFPEYTNFFFRINREKKTIKAKQSMWCAETNRNSSFTVPSNDYFA